MGEYKILNYNCIQRRQETSEEIEIKKMLSNQDPILRLQLVKNHPTWNLMNNFSHLASNCIEWIPIEKNDCILIIDCGYGNYAERIVHKCNSTYVITNDYTKSCILQQRFMHEDNITIFLGYLNDLVEQVQIKFTKILLIGVTSKINCLLKCNWKNKKQIFAELKGMLESKGTMIIIDDNKLGIKYLNGAKQSDDEPYFAQIERSYNTSEQTLLSKKEYSELLKNIGFDKLVFYYPYPDYKYTDSVFSDDYMPSRNDMIYDQYNWEKYGFNLFRDSSILKTMIDEQMFDKFCNSFIIFASNQQERNKPVYIKYSNDRTLNFGIKTEVFLREEKKYVKKTALNYMTKKHLKKMFKTYEESLRNNDNNFELCKISSSENALYYEYIEGNVVSNIVEKMDKINQFEAIESIFDKLDDIITNKKIKWHETEEFFQVFGDVDFEDEMFECTFNNIDMILPNIIEDINSKWIIIDYEWKFDFPVPAPYVLWRSIFYINKAKSQLDKDENWKEKLYKKFNLTKEVRQKFFLMEKNFQKYVLGGFLSLAQIRRTEHNVISTNEAEYFKMVDNKFDSNNRKKVEGIQLINGNVQYTIPLNYNECQAVRIDPCSHKCLVHINTINNGYGVELKYRTNANKICGKDNYLFLSNDPQIIIDDMRYVVNQVKVDYDIVNLPNNFSI